MSLYFYTRFRLVIFSWSDYAMIYISFGIVYLSSSITLFKRTSALIEPTTIFLILSFTLSYFSFIWNYSKDFTSGKQLILPYFLHGITLSYREQILPFSLLEIKLLESINIQKTINASINVSLQPYVYAVLWKFSSLDFILKLLKNNFIQTKCHRNFIIKNLLRKAKL